MFMLSHRKLMKAAYCVRLQNGGGAAPGASPSFARTLLHKSSWIRDRGPVRSRSSHACIHHARVAAPTPACCSGTCALHTHTYMQIWVKVGFAASHKAGLLTVSRAAARTPSCRRMAWQQ